MSNFPVKNISVHLELTDKCQASCPMCPRNHLGGSERSHIKNVEITLDTFKQWFTPEFLEGVNSMCVCGNNGDPLMAKDCLEIFKYTREINPNIVLSVHTNGSLRSSAWWRELAEVLGPNGVVVFAIDGWKGEHEIYRRGTFWDKIIENAKTFIEAGGRAKSDTIIFKHNEERIHELEEYLLGLGFESVNLKPTHRFYGMDKFPVHDRNDNVEYYIEPAVGDEWNTNIPKPNFVKMIDKTEFNKMLHGAKIEPECSKGYSLYVNAYGRAYPCCWVGSLIENSSVIVADSNEKIIRERLADSAVDIMDDIGSVDLTNSDLLTEFARVDWDSKISKHWTSDPKLVCVKSCATNFSAIIK